VDIFYFKIIKDFLYKIFVAIVINIRKMVARKSILILFYVRWERERKIKDLTYIHTGLKIFLFS